MADWSIECGFIALIFYKLIQKLFFLPHFDEVMTQSVNICRFQSSKYTYPNYKFTIQIPTISYKHWIIWLWVTLNTKHSRNWRSFSFSFWQFTQIQCLKITFGQINNIFLWLNRWQPHISERIEIHWLSVANEHCQTAKKVVVPVSVK